MNIITTIKEHGGFISNKDINERYMYDKLLEEVRQGNVVRVKTGVYALPDELAKTMVDISKVVPGGVLCMYSAWAHYNLTTTLPPDICVAIEKNHKVRLPDYPPIALYYWTKNYYEMGITETEIDGFKVSIYDIEKSVCDAIKFRNKIGYDICAEVLKEYLRRKNRNLTRLHQYAKIMRVENILNNLITFIV